MKKKIMSLTVIATLSISLLAGCGGQEATKQPAQEPAAAEATTSVDAASFKSEAPVIVTSFGQSADAAMLKAIMNKTGVEFTYDNLAKADALGEAKTMIVAVGASSKGLGAAGIKPEEELKRAEAVIKAAKDKGMKVVIAHLGGESRRGKLSDEFIDVGLNGADYLIVVETGNNDGKFTDFAADKKIPISLVPSIAKSTETLSNIFK